MQQNITVCKTISGEVYQNIVNHLLRSDVDRDKIGKHIILPASHPGSRRDMHSRFQDAMAVVSRVGKGKVDLFITVTANPKWKEVQDQLCPGMKGEDRTDVEARVFKEKLKAIEEELYKKNIIT